MAWLGRYNLELDPHFDGILGRHTRKPWSKCAPLAPLSPPCTCQKRGGAGTWSKPPLPLPPTPASPAPANSPKKGRFVRAMFDHEAEAEDELTFKVGDMVEVLETMDGGWWSGRCNGMVGDFPVDYVDTTNFEA